MFDGVHAGHIFLLDHLRRCSVEAGCNVAPIAFTFANHPLSVLRPMAAPRLLTSAKEKAALIEGVGIEAVMLNFDCALQSLTAREFIVKLREGYGVDGLLLGFNNRFGSDKGLTFDDYCRIGHECGVEVVCAPEFSELKVSSSIVRQLIAAGNVAEAARLLLRPYNIAGTVVSGNHIGRTIGFPTINLQPTDPSKLIPATGVYAGEAMLADGSLFQALINIGHRPTVDNSEEIRIEAHLVGFTGDLYDAEVDLRFCRRIRDERRFPNLTSLRAQIHSDLETLRDN